MKDRVLGEEEEMDVHSSLRRAQSLRSVSTDRDLSWTEAGLRDKRTSVSQLVAQYQNSPGRKAKEGDSGDIKHELNMRTTTIPVSENESRVETPVRKTDVKESSRVSPLSRSKSMESLPRHRPTGTTALRALFESKITTQTESKKSKTAPESASAEKANNTTLSDNKDAEDTKPQVQVNNSHNEQEKVTEEVQVITKSARTKQSIIQSDRRKTVSGIHSEKISSPEEDKRRSVADFRDSSALYELEKPSISVKALSALYLSKVAAAKPAGNLLKPDHNLTSPTGKKPNAIKMAEGAQNSIAYAPESNPPIHHLETNSEEHERPFTSPPPTREAMSILYQRQQKCELRRLLKHTYPELKDLDSLVEKELADILNLDPVPDTGYQSEVQSRCWLFENREINSVDTHDQKAQMKKEFQEGDIKRTVCMFEQPSSNSYNKDNKLNKSEEVTSEESIKVDVKATRKMFETHSMGSQNPCPRKNISCEEERQSGQKPKSDSETDGKKTSEIRHKSLTSDVIDTNEVFVSISKAKQIFETISPDKKNISPANDNLIQEEELLRANVRNRAQMFESTPLDRINQQTKEELETILENTQETLVSLCNFSIVHSDGTILEANETGHVKKARYHFIQEETRAAIHEEEIVTGSIKSIMLQMLPGTNLNPTVTFLKEDSQGNVEIQQVDVPIHQLPFTRDKECRNANVVQITEDLLSQKNSLRKGVLIQDGTTGMREITVYALFIHSEDSTGVMEFGQADFRTIPSSLRNVPESENGDLKTDSSPESSSVLDTSKTSNNVQLFQSCIEKEDFDHLKCLQEASNVDIGASTGDATEIISGKVNNIKALFATNIDDTSFNIQSNENKSKWSPKERLVNDEKDNAIATIQSEHSPDTGDNLKNERIPQNQDIMNDGVVLQAELVDVVEDDELVNLQTAIMKLHQATMEAKALQQSVQAKYTSQKNQTHQICDSDSMTQEFAHVKNNDNVSENNELSQYPKNELEEESKEDVMRGSIQSALDSLGKSNFNVTKGDFRAAMIYRNSGKGYAGQKKTNDLMMNQMRQPSERTKESKSAISYPVPQAEKEALKSPEGTDTTLWERSVSVEKPAKNRKTPIGPKPAIPPKPDHLKIKPNLLGSEIDTERLDKCQVPPASSKPPTEQIKQSSISKPCPDSMSQEDAHESVEHTDANETEPSNTSVKITEHPRDEKLNCVEVVEETPKSSPESIVNESSSGFHATLQNFRVKQSGSVPPVKPKRIKMAEKNLKNTDNTNPFNSTTLETEPAQGITPPHDNDSSGETCKTESENRKERNDKSDGQQVSGVVRREKKIRGETEDERRQRLSVHMDEIIKGNVPAVMEIFDKLKKQEELKNILSKMEEIEEDTNKVDVSSLKNIFENVPDWVVPREPKIVPPKHTEAPSKPEMMSSMEVAFGDLEKAGTEIIYLKDQTLARLMDIEEAIKKALYSVSTLKSDSDILGLSGLFRESMVTVQGSSPSGNIRTISIGSSKSPKAQNQIGKMVSEQSMTQKTPELFIPTTKQRSASPTSPSFISIQSAARKPSELPSPQISPQKEEPKEETKLQCCCSVPSDRRQCSVTKESSSSPVKPRRQVSVLEVQTKPEEEGVIGTKTISENYERKDCFGNKFYSSKTSTVVTTQPETRTTSEKLIMSSPATSEIVTYPRINTPFIREDCPKL
ncbi:xin actin-binding repeat-containing protein 1-like isoform X1 [Carassius auratus]|uniref:Xin actin-binding repeat-containing protein 1-like isoform X1 n=2 Tax=Carassius auratus TaxID=7957 RepID=A0A6P6MDC6_CARAU|nr:xin actin-binding repeat-containing protein 1-like isoform X1 [Carassius auratus]XP_026093962.1 xin actin-binding repeat-containing protein 1-like isoform X1 [Carassius auratus]